MRRCDIGARVVVCGVHRGRQRCGSHVPQPSSLGCDAEICKSQCRDPVPQQTRPVKILSTAPMAARLCYEPLHPQRTVRSL